MNGHGDFSSDYLQRVSNHSSSLSAHLLFYAYALGCSDTYFGSYDDNLFKKSLGHSDKNVNFAIN